MSRGPDRWHAPGILALSALLLCPVLAFGGSNPVVALSFAVLCVFHALMSGAHPWRRMDRALFLLLASVALQLIPLPLPLVNFLSPHAGTVRTALALVPSEPSWRPLAVDPRATAMATIELTGTVALFFAAREQFRDGGVRRVARAISGTGLGISILAILQAATGTRHIYWMFDTGNTGQLPFGTFVNRNHFAMWVVMALPVGLGYMMTRRESSRRAPNGQRGRRRSMDARGVWLAVAAAVMLFALLLSLSQSAAIGLGISAVAAAWSLRKTIGSRASRTLAVSAVSATVIAVSLAELPPVRRRVTGTPDEPSRVRVWRETAPLVHDFAVTGVGVGGFEMAMRVYQRSERTVAFNQARNQYLQSAAEGGLLVLLPFALTIWFFIRAARTELARDRGPTWWIRVGAACGLAAAALQSAFETGLVMSANSGLMAVLGAIVVHRRHRDHRGTEGR